MLDNKFSLFDEEDNEESIKVIDKASQEKLTRASEYGSLMNVFLDHTPVVETFDLISKRTAILGSSGTGKSNSVAVLVEELCEKGCGVTIIDPDSDYWSLATEIPLLKVGKAAYCDLDVPESGADALAKRALADNLTVLLDFSQHTDGERNLFLLRYVSSLFDNAMLIRRPHMLVVDEASEFIPQRLSQDEGQKALQEKMVQIAKRGRSRGIGMIISDQRSASISKEVLSQCTVFILHAVGHPVDLGIYKDLVSDSFGNVKGLKHIIEEMAQGDALAYLVADRRGASRWYRGRVRLRTSYHPGYSPDLLNGEVAEERTLIGVDQKLLASIKMDVEGSLSASRPEHKFIKVEKALLEAQQKVKEISNENDHLRDRVNTLSKLELKIDSASFARAFRAVLKEETLPEEV